MYKLILSVYFLFLSVNFFGNLGIERFNREMYSFNRGMEKVIIKPCADFYISVLPKIFKIKINNLFSGIELTQSMFVNFFYNKIIFTFNVHVLNSLNLAVFSFLTFDILKIKLLDLDNFFFTFCDFEYIFLPCLGPGVLNNYVFLLFIQFFNIFLYNDCVFYYFFYIINKKVYLSYDFNFFHFAIPDGYSFLKDVFFQIKIFNKRV